VLQQLDQSLTPCFSSVPGSDELEQTTQATMWLGTEDGCIHIYHCGENIRLKKNRIRIQQGAAVLCLL
jgi:Rho guanine nucleotide exchange factor 17